MERHRKRKKQKITVTEQAYHTLTTNFTNKNGYTNASWELQMKFQLEGECQGIMRKGARPASPSRRPSAEVIPPQVAEAFSQDDPNTSGFNSQENHPTKILV
jgi:hypothetical protein